MDTTTVAHGELRGRRQEGVTAFLGVPYAAPPVGDARFRPPRPPLAWDGVRDATRIGPAAPQLRSRLAHVMGDHEIEQSEDCLTLNVWTPDPSGPSRPVLVFLHGGGFVTGSGGLDWYHGAELARRGDIVVVTVNYRLGVLGFLYLGEANLGLRDQVQALRWVRDEIAAFGGDPGAVTAVGQSGGALSILAMLSTPSARGLFHRAVLQSTPAGLRPQTVDEAEAVATELLTLVGGPRDVPVAELLAAQQEMARRHPGVAPAFQLVGDGVTASADLIAGAAAGVPILIGTTRDESTVFPGADVTESLFRAPSERLAQRLAGSGTPVWMYRFDWSPPGSPFGACHCIELPFVFGNAAAWRDAPMLAGADPGTVAALVDVVQPAWIAFVRDGDPGWPPYLPERAVRSLSLEKGRP
jgi:para-nitrobenzyl esterase